MPVAKVSVSHSEIVNSPLLHQYLHISPSYLNIAAAAADAAAAAALKV